MHKKKRLFPNVVDGHCFYGKNAQRPDLDIVIFDSKKEEFLKNLKLSEAERKSMYQNTTAQSLSHIWLQERRKRLTASNFGAVCNKLPYTLCDCIVKKVLYSNFESTGMRYGRLHERDL